jgi:LAGLIDADG-like domain
MALFDRIAKGAKDSLNPQYGNATRGNPPQGVSSEAFVIPGSVQDVPKPKLLEELGVTGLLRTRGVGYVYEEWLLDLSTYRQKQIYREMRDNDAVIGALFFALEMILRKAEWHVEQADGDKGGKYAQFVEECMQDMSHTWESFIAECVDMFAFGYSLFETVYKRRLGPDGRQASKYNDGLIGWRKQAPRAQESILYWIWDDEGGLQGAVQLAAPDYHTVPIPIQKMLLFRTTSIKNNPEGRACTLETPIPTPDGWATFGDINVGDSVFDENGEPTKVTAKSEVWKDRTVFEVQFSKETSIKADGSHLWAVTTHNDRGECKPPRILSTQQIYDELQTGKPKHFSCGQAPILQCEEKEFLLDPYYLGYWLGNGTCHSSNVRCDVKDARELRSYFRACGYHAHTPVKLYEEGDNTRTIRVRSKKKKWDSDCPSVQLRKLGVKDSKHIPAEYLRSSVNQRLSLLQGLMDSDGSASPGGDEIAFCNTNMSLIYGVAELVRTLGGVPRVRLAQRAGRVSTSGVISRQDVYCVAFRLDLPAFRLLRKLKRQKLEKTSRNSGHFIRAVVPAENADTVCIEVDSPSHLFLAGEGAVPTHNSLLRNVYRTWFFKRRIEEVEGIGIERDLCGIPVLYSSMEALQAMGGMDEAKKMVTNIRIDDQAGVVLPLAYDEKGNSLVKLELLKAAGSKQTNAGATINRYNQDILNTVLAGFVQLGQTPTGSRSMHMSATEIFSLAISAYMDEVASVMNRIAVTRLFQLNKFPLDMCPRIVPGEIGVRDIEELAQSIQQLSMAGFSFIDTPTQDYVRKVARLPEMPKDEEGNPAGSEDSTDPNALLQNVQTAVQSGQLKYEDLQRMMNGLTHPQAQSSQNQ